MRIKPKLFCIILWSLVFGFYGVSATNEPDRWDLSHLYKNPQEWYESFELVQTEIQNFSNRIRQQDKLDLNSLSVLLDEAIHLKKQTAQLYSYALLRRDEDMTNQMMKENYRKTTFLTNQLEFSLIQLGNKVGSTSTLKQQFVATPKNRNYILLKPYLAPNLNPIDIEILTAAKITKARMHHVFTRVMLQRTDWPVTTLSTGDAALLSPSSFTHYRTSKSSKDRTRVALEFFNKLSSLANLTASTLVGSVKAQHQEALSRGYNSTFELAILGKEVPAQYYDQLITNLETLRPALQRIIAYKAKRLGLKKMRYEDLWAPPHLQINIPLQETKTSLITAMVPLGNQYGTRLSNGLAGSWMDVYPRPGKRSGAYTQGSAYVTHPYLLLNYRETFTDSGTFAHEWGHALHALISQESNPFETARPNRLIAEIIGATSEVLLHNHLIEKETSLEKQLAYIEYTLQWIYQTFFRNVLKATFEKALHDQIASDIPLGHAHINSLYLNHLKNIHPQNVIIPDMYESEWVYEPSYYDGFRAYQYAIAAAASAKLAEDFKYQPHSTHSFLKLLESGGTEELHDLLTKTGIDLTTSTAYDTLSKRINYLIDKAEEILVSQRH